MEKTERKKKLKIFLKVLKKVVSPRQFIFLIVILAANTFAWFIYANKVSNSIDVSVRSWKILLKSGEDTITDYAQMTIDSIYPGTNYTEQLKAYNLGEVNAEITYTILSARFFGETIYTQEYYNDKNETVPSDAITSEQLESALTLMPFAINFNVDNKTLKSGDGEATFSAEVNWPYESGDDETDTYWGNLAYNYEQSNTTDPAIEILVKLYVQQKSE